MRSNMEEIMVRGVEVKAALAAMTMR